MQMYNLPYSRAGNRSYIAFLPTQCFYMYLIFSEICKNIILLLSIITIIHIVIFHFPSLGEKSRGWIKIASTQSFQIYHNFLNLFHNAFVLKISQFFFLMCVNLYSHLNLATKFTHISFLEI